MTDIIVEISKYLLLAFILLFTIFTYAAMRAKTGASRRDATRAQLVFMLLFNFLAYAVIFLQETVFVSSPVSLKRFSFASSAEQSVSMVLMTLHAVSLPRLTRHRL